MVNFLGGGGWGGMRPGGTPIADPIRRVMPPTPGPDQRPVGGPVRRVFNPPGSEGPPGVRPPGGGNPIDPIKRRFAQPLRGRTVPMASLLNPGQGRMELA